MTKKSIMVITVLNVRKIVSGKFAVYCLTTVFYKKDKNKQIMKVFELI